MNLPKACAAEFIGTLALIFVGVSVIILSPKSGVGVVGVALAHGLTIAVMVSATGHISGGHLNPAVTVGVFFGGKIAPGNAFAYIVSQCAGAVAGAAIAKLILVPTVVTVGLVSDLALKEIWYGTPVPAYGVTFPTATMADFMLTFFLVFVVYGTGVDPRANFRIMGLAIGLTITLGILALGPLARPAMNPARALGPAVVFGVWEMHGVYWVGSILGGGLAGLIYGRWLLQPDGGKA